MGMTSLVRSSLAPPTEVRLRRYLSKAMEIISWGGWEIEQLLAAALLSTSVLLPWLVLTVLGKVRICLVPCDERQARISSVCVCVYLEVSKFNQKRYSQTLCSIQIELPHSSSPLSETSRDHHQTRPPRSPLLGILLHLLRPPRVYTIDKDSHWQGEHQVRRAVQAKHAGTRTTNVS